MIEWSYGTDVCDIPMLDDYMFINARSVPTDKGGKPVPALFGRMRFNADAVYQQVSQSGYLQGAEFRERIWPEQETVECRPLMPLLNQHVSMTIMGGMFNSKPIRLGDKYLLLKGATSKVKDSFTEANGDDGVKPRRGRETDRLHRGPGSGGRRIHQIRIMSTSAGGAVWK